MDDVLELVAGGQVAAVKIVLASVVTALAVYQALLMTVVYRRLRPAFLKPPAAAEAHRTVGDSIVALVVVVGLACLLEYGIEDSVRGGTPGPEERAGWHSALSLALVAVLAFKILVLHRWHRLDRFLPLIGVTLLTLFLLTWSTSAGAFLWGPG